MSRLLLNVLFVKFPVGQILSLLLQSRQERRKKKRDSDRDCNGDLQKRQGGSQLSLSLTPHRGEGKQGVNGERRIPPGRSGERKAPQTQAEEGQRARHHLENLVLHLLQPPQHPGEGQCSLAGRRQGSRMVQPPQLQVRLGSGSPGPARALAASRHLL